MSDKNIVWVSRYGNTLASYRYRAQIPCQEVAKINGAKPWRAFIEITWPLNWIGTAIGMILVFIPCLANAITPRFLGGPDATSFGMSLSQQFGETGTWALGSAMGVFLFLASLAVILAIRPTIRLKRSGFTGVITS